MSTSLRLLCFFAATFLAVANLHAAPPKEQAGLHLIYEGMFEPEQDDGRGAKNLDLEFILLSDGEVGWTISERGRGAFSWPERFGVAAMAADGSLAAKDRPALLMLREEGRHVVAIDLPFVQLPDQPALDAKWQVGKLSATINGEGKRGEFDCWEIDYISPIGYKRTAWVAKDSRVAVEWKELVFLGPGQKHQLTAKLKSFKELPADQLEKVTTSFTAWRKLRDELKREPRTEKAELNPEQLALVKAQIPELTKSAAGPLAGILAAADRDARNQKDRTQSLAHIKANIVGEKLPAWTLKDLAGKSWSSADLAGKVIVLHFWEYRDVPLEEPYGQVAYVDFLQRRLKDQAVVLGVHVDKRLENEETQRAAISTAKKLRDFMRLSYPILLDDGAFLKQVGDPRPVGGDLPLYIVIGRDGKVVEHHAGVYAVQRERGLEELEAIVTKANSP